MSRRRVYLDYNATAPLRPEAKEAMLAAIDAVGNASSVHAEGRHARALIERSRRTIAERLGVAADRVVFTSGGTEANHLALLGFQGSRMVSAIEHASVLDADPEAVRILAKGDGVVELASLQNAIELNEPKLVSLMLANNETGVIQPVAEAAAMAHRAEALLHCDAVQAFGRIEVDPKHLGADLLTISAHKLGGPQGVGALVLREGLEPEALLRGGGQEGRRRAGTENVAAIAGFAAAAAASTDWDAVRRLRDRIETRLPWPVRVVGADAERLPNTTCIITGGLKAETVVIGLDLAGIAVSSGAACSSGKVARSHVLLAMGFGSGSDAAIRVSLGWATTADDVLAFVTEYTRIVKSAGLL